MLGCVFYRKYTYWLGLPRIYSLSFHGYLFHNTSFLKLSPMMDCPVELVIVKFGTFGFKPYVL